MDSWYYFLLYTWSPEAEVCCRSTFLLKPPLVRLVPFLSMTKVDEDSDVVLGLFSLSFFFLHVEKQLLVPRKEWPRDRFEAGRTCQDELGS
ncbi:hypothetical protein LZ32DRAFT_601726 [Colletotrichum eremochloae]|nr:hypothetical protein LZ32DRAFT_601726 [Colletotrichum eremochloae]